MDWETIVESLKYLAQPMYLYIAITALLLAFVLILLLRRQPKNVAAYSTSNGQVMVSRSAIFELVQTSCIQIEEVSKPQVRMKIKGGKKHFEVRLKLASGAQLRSIEEILQQHLRKALTENLGIEDLGRIDIVATGFKSGKLDSSSSITKKEPEPVIEEAPTEDIIDSSEEPKNY